MRNIIEADDIEACYKAELENYMSRVETILDYYKTNPSRLTDKNTAYLKDLASDLDDFLDTGEILGIEIDEERKFVWQIEKISRTY